MEIEDLLNKEFKIIILRKLRKLQERKEKKRKSGKQYTNKFNKEIKIPPKNE